MKPLAFTESPGKRERANYICVECDAAVDLDRSARPQAYWHTQIIPAMSIPAETICHRCGDRIQPQGDELC